MFAFQSRDRDSTIRRWRSPNLAVDILSHLLSLAHKYDVKKLRSLCVNQLLDHMNLDNVSELAALSHIYNLPLLKEKSLEMIAEFLQEVTKTEGWKILLKKAPELCTDIILGQYQNPNFIKIKSGLM